MDNLGVCFARKNTLSNISYSGGNVALTQYLTNNYFVGGEGQVPNREQAFHPP